MAATACDNDPIVEARSYVHKMATAVTMTLADEAQLQVHKVELRRPVRSVYSSAVAGPRGVPHNSSLVSAPSTLDGLPSL